MKIKNLKAVVLSVALAASAASEAFSLDLPAVYREASAPWSAEQAARLPSVLTPETLTALAKTYGADPAKALADKKEKVSALMGRFRTCDLNGEDLKTAEAHLDKGFKAEVLYFADQGCKAVKGSVKPGQAPQAPTLAQLEVFASAGPAAFENGARLFDGAADRASAPEAFLKGTTGTAVRKAAPQASSVTRPLAAAVPAPVAAMPDISAPPGIPAIGETGRVNQALVFWKEMRKENYRALRGGNLSAAGTAEAAAKLTASLFFGGVLMYSNLPNVEEAAARLRRDNGQGAGARALMEDAAKLAFHSALFVVSLLPLSTIKMIKDAVRLEPQALALLALKSFSYFNRYVLVRTRFGFEDLDTYSILDIIPIHKK